VSAYHGGKLTNMKRKVIYDKKNAWVIKLVTPKKSVEIDGHEVEIDSHLADLITSLNQVGLSTTSCCSGHNNHCAHITFKTRNIVDVAFSPFRDSFTIWWRMFDSDKKDAQEVEHAENTDVVCPMCGGEGRVMRNACTLKIWKEETGWTSE